MDGWIKLHRKILDNPISYSVELLAIMSYMLLRANHTDTTIYLGLNKIELKEGQFVSSQRKIADRFGLPISKVHRIIKVLGDELILKHEGNTKYTVFTILNWNIYQGTETQVKHKGNTNETKKETDKKYNNENNENNNISLGEFIPKWNAVEKIGDKKGFMKCKGETKDLKLAWDKIIKNYSKEEIELGVRNYITDIKNRKEDVKGYWLHRFSLYEFITQKNGLKLYINK